MPKSLVADPLQLFIEDGDGEPERPAEAEARAAVERIWSQVHPSPEDTAE